ncbi:MAG TPA: LysR substrate-binding domain-containing protein, partial [Dehalococcoidia bacterium]|nr:LysR substrate-binding domain-containing protein [Dehalococcoidia bacterium]
KRAVLAGLGVGLTSMYALEVELQAARLRVLPVAAFAGRRMLYIARQRNAPLTAAQAAFLELARAVKETDLMGRAARTIAPPTAGVE